MAFAISKILIISQIWKIMTMLGLADKLLD